MTTRRQALVLSNSYFKWQIVDYATPTEKLPTNESLFVILLDSNKNVTKLLTKVCISIKTTYKSYIINV